MNFINPTGRTALLLGFGLLLSACGGGGGTSAGAEPGTSGDFVVIETDPQTNGLLFLNDTLKIDFSNPVDITSANLTTVTFQVFDSTGQPLTEQPAGTFRLAVRPGDSTPGRRLEFVPRFPTNDAFNNGGFRPGRTYIVSLVTGIGQNGNTLQDVNQNPLAVPRSFSFSTANGTTPAQLFRDTLVGGPRSLTPGNVDVEPVVVENGAPLRPGLSWIGQRQLEVRLSFDQALNPSSANLPTGLVLDPANRGDIDSARIRLEYTDTRTSNTVTIPVQSELAENLPDRSTVVLRPLGVLPNNAEIRVIVEATLEDISGESNVGNASSFDSLFATFFTREVYEPQFDAIIEDFVSVENIDFEAAFLEPPAVVQEGELRAGFEFDGAATSLTYRPTQTEVLLNTDFTQITPDNGAPFSVTGGVFRFDSVIIPSTTIVRGIGSRPMVWVVNKDFVVNGTLTVRGGNGDRTNSLNSANTPSGGGIGVCGGGQGGRGSPSTLGRSLSGEAGFGPGNIPSGGGRPGLIGCTAGCLGGGELGGGSGGGGGSFTTQGDPSLTRPGGPVSGALNTFPQQAGIGGQGCNNKSLAGGQPGPLAFRDSRGDNDFWGGSIDTFRNIRITGELPNPIGGQGGGGGGDSNPGNCNPIDPLFANDNKGGGGGGGGGVLIIQALGDIVIGPNGRIDANGGDGGGGEEAGSCNEAGGGGGGSGGMVILQAGRQIRFTIQGQTFQGNDYRFPVAADGGAMISGDFRSPNVTQKYPLSLMGPTFQYTASTYNTRPFGGLGGMGVVQLMAPPGTGSSNVDGTNTILDDNIILTNDQGTELNGAAKINFLGWRGNVQPNGSRVDDSGTAITVNVEGDIRPFPILLPAPFGPTSKAISKWIDTGVSVREGIIADDGQPRGVVPVTAQDGTAFGGGPFYRFDGTISGSAGGAVDGYVAFEPAAPGSPDLRIPFDLIAEGNVLTVETGQTFEGASSYRVTLTAAQLGNVDNRFNHYQAVLFDSLNAEVGNFRVLGHTDRVLNLEADGPISGQVSRVEVREQLFEVLTGGAPGLGPTYVGGSGSPLPVSNVRIGFAFHRNPAQEQTTGFDALRFPNNAGEFLYDLSDPAVQQTVRNGLNNSGAYPFVRWEVLFDSRFRTNTLDAPPAIGPTTRRPALRYLRLPFQF